VSRPPFICTKKLFAIILKSLWTHICDVAGSRNPIQNCGWTVTLWAHSRSVHVYMEAPVYDLWATGQDGQCMELWDWDARAHEAVPGRAILGSHPPHRYNSF
jgi:hypothetical protein